MACSGMVLWLGNLPNDYTDTLVSARLFLVWVTCSSACACFIVFVRRWALAILERLNAKGTLWGSILVHPCWEQSLVPNGRHWPKIVAILQSTCLLLLRHLQEWAILQACRIFLKHCQVQVFLCVKLAGLSGRIVPLNSTVTAIFDSSIVYI